MAYGRDLVGSARRHLAAAVLLHVQDRPSHSSGDKAVAGYLFGLAGELALKEMMRDSGMRELAVSQRREDPFYAHFPDIKALLRDHAAGRRHGELLKYANNTSLFQHWDTDMRYAPTRDVSDAWTQRWKSQAENLVSNMDL
jgi:hypothetical protein